MNESWLSEVERSRLTSFPEYIPEEDLIAFFTLTSADQQLIRKRSGASNRLGAALQLCALRYMGFIPEDLNSAPSSALGFLTRQLGVEETSLGAYGAREQTRSDHRQIIEKHLGYRRAGIGEWERIERWLGLRALEHDRPSFLLQLLCERLQTLKFVRPGWSALERAVASARQQAHDDTWRMVEDQVKGADRDKLDGLLIVPKNERFTPLTRFRTSATSHSAQAILHTLEKIGELKALGIARWDLSRLNPNRLKMLAQKGRKATNQALGRMPPERRYPILLAFLKQTLIDTIDEAVDLYDRCLQEAYSRAGRELDEFRIHVANSANEKVHLFQTIGEIILDPAVEDSRLRSVIYQKIAPEKLRAAVDECEDISRPLDDSYFDLLGTRYSNLRQFAPRFLETFEWRAADDDEPLLEAITILRELNTARLRKVPDDAPHEFIPAKWLPYVMLENGQYSRRYYELCLLWEMRTALRNGKLWIEGSRRYTDPETYLIPPGQWLEMKAEACRLMKVSGDGASRLEMKTVEFRAVAEELARHLAGQDTVRIEDGELIVGPLEAEERSASCQELEEMIAERLPRIDLPAVLIEVDGWVNFTGALRHAGGGASRREEILELLHASILAQSGNFGLTQMARMSGFNHQRLFWVTHWHLREETLREATTMMVNYHHHLPLSRLLGGGTLSSSDGQRFPVAVKTANATPLPKYYGYGRGLTFYTWTSDQCSQWGTKPIPSTTRDATFVLDEILDNETELPLFTHATDTAGYTELIFCLFDLLGYRFAPRLRDLGDQTLYRVDPEADFGAVNQLLTGRFHPEWFLDQWDDMLRLAGSLKMGWVTASLLIGKLNAMSKHNTLVGAMQEYGRLIKTNFILQYLCNPEFRRQIHRQLNKGEALHALRRYLMVAQEGHIRKRYPDDQLNQAHCLNLVTNAVVVWNTVYMWEAIEQLKREGRQIDEEDMKHLSPARYEHINVYGRYFFPVREEMSRKGLRPLRKPGEDD